MRRTVLGAALACAVIGGWPVRGSAQQPPLALPVTVARPVVKDIVDWDVFTGRFAAVETVEIRARVDGYLQSIHFQDGALVKKGDRLFVIDPRPYQATLNQTEAQLKSAQTQVDFARADFERAQNLIRTGNVSEQVFDQRRQQFLAAQANADAQRAATEVARLNLEFTEVRAPIDGRISRKYVSAGNLVAGGSSNATLLTTIVALDPIHFYFDVDEQRYLSYQRLTQQFSEAMGTVGSHGTGILVYVGLSDEKAIDRPGTLDFLDNRIDEASGTIRARATFENKDFLMTPGLFGRIRIPATERYRAVLLPDEAIIADQERRLVNVVGEDGSVSLREVRPGPLADGYRVIRTGLSGDEAVIVKGLQRARPGGKVVPQMTVLPPTRESKGW
jgi:multidrug efflux system membrane fusion protein